MTHAYRDDLDAAQARVSDLEREAQQLRARNAELESLERRKREAREARENAQRVEAGDAEPEKPSTAVRTLLALTRMCLGIAVVALLGPTHPSVGAGSHPVWSLIFFVLGLLFWCCSGFRNFWK